MKYTASRISPRTLSNMADLPRVYFDITIGGVKAGRIEMEVSCVSLMSVLSTAVRGGWVVVLRFTRGPT